MKSGAEQLDPTGTDPQIYYLHVRLSVPRQNHRSFVVLMERLLTVIHDIYGWEFVHGSYPISGEVNRFVHVWKIPDPVDVLHIMRHGAFNPKAADSRSSGDVGTNSKKHKYFRAMYWELQGLITETTHLLTTALPADPNYEGYQSQTILVDHGGKEPPWYLLDHEMMKDRWKDKDIRQHIDALQFYERRARLAKEAPPKKVTKPSNDFDNYAEWAADEDYRRLMGRLQRREKEALTVGDPAKQPGNFPKIKDRAVDWEGIAKIRELLNFGVTHASIASPLQEKKGGGASATLVNLGALKPRSVQQEGYLPPDSARKTLESGPLKNGTSMDKLVIAAPWGSVYCVDHEDVTEVARTVDFGRAGKPAEATTNQRVATFTEGNIPMGTILEPRAGQIGDGCACYVINLNAMKPPASKAVPNGKQPKRRS